MANALTDSEAAGVALSAAIQQFGEGLREGKRTVLDVAEFQQAQQAQQIETAFKKRSVQLQAESLDLRRTMATATDDRARNRISVFRGQLKVEQQRADTASGIAGFERRLKEAALFKQVGKDLGAKWDLRHPKGFDKWENLPAAAQKKFTQSALYFQFPGLFKRPSNLHELPKDKNTVGELLRGYSIIGDLTNKEIISLMLEGDIVDSNGNPVPSPEPVPESSTVPGAVLPVAKPGPVIASPGRISGRTPQQAVFPSLNLAEAARKKGEEIRKRREGKSAAERVGLPGFSTKTEKDSTDRQSNILTLIDSKPDVISERVKQLQGLPSEKAKDALDETINQIKDEIDAGLLSDAELSNIYEVTASSFASIGATVESIKKDVESLSGE